MSWEKKKDSVWGESEPPSWSENAPLLMTPDDEEEEDDRSLVFQKEEGEVVGMVGEEEGGGEEEVGGESLELVKCYGVSSTDDEENECMICFSSLVKGGLTTVVLRFVLSKKKKKIQREIEIEIEIEIERKR